MAKSVVWNPSYDDLVEWVPQFDTFAALFRHFNLPVEANPYRDMRRRLRREGISYSHIRMGRGALKGRKMKQPGEYASRKPKESERVWHREHYARNRESEIKRVADRKARVRAWFEFYRSALSCQKCGEDRGPCLDFHHRNPADKKWNIATMVNRGFSEKHILEEIAKCDILCANCHRMLHHNIRLDTEMVSPTGIEPVL